MKKKWIVFTGLLFIITAGIISSKFIINYRAEREEQDQLVREYGEAANFLALGTYHSYSEERNDIVLFPTNLTSYRLDRWQLVGQLTDHFDYPEEKIKANDWLGAHRTFIKEYNHYYQLFREGKADITIRPADLRYFILDGATTDGLETLLNENNLDELE